MLKSRFMTEKIEDHLKYIDKRTRALEGTFNYNTLNLRSEHHHAAILDYIEKIEFFTQTEGTVI